MSALMSFATGFLNGSVQVQREKAAKEIADKEAKALTQKEAVDRFAGLNFKDTPKEVALLFGKQAFGPDFTLADVGNMFNKAGSTQTFGTYDLNLVQEYDYKTMNGFDRSQIFWQSFNSQLSSEQGFQKALSHFKANPRDAQLLGDAVRTNEYELRVGNVGRQKGTGVEDTGIQYIDLDGQYGNATRLFDELGIKNVSEDANRDIASQVIDFDPETEIPVLMNTRQTGGSMVPVAVGMDKNTYSILAEMSSKTGYGTVQNMVTDFSVDADFRKIDETNEQFALRQNEILTKAATMYGTGFADYLSNPARMDGATTKGHLDKLAEITGGDREEQIRIMSLMVKTPANTFSRARKYRYSQNNSQAIKAIPTGTMFVERVTGLKADDFNEGFAAQEDAVQYLDRLQELEKELGEQVGTGWVRGFAATAKRFGIQLEQGSTTLSSLFGKSGDFSQTASGTELSDLQATIQAVNPAINLADISESDALKLTLAAKMARAIDPSGRLSNQDFEIQLRRLGDGAFDTPQDIARKLATVRKDFEKDLQYKRRLKSVMDDQTELTPQVARSIQASLRLRNLEGQIFGVAGRDEIAGAGQQRPAALSEETPVVAQPQSLPEYDTSSGTVFYGPDAGGKFYKDPQGTQVVSPAEFRQAQQST